MALLLIGCGGEPAVVAPPATGALDVSTSGLPALANAQVVVTGPHGFSRALPASATLAGLVPGTYSIEASAVTISGNTFAPSPASQSVEVAAGTAHAAASVTYAITTGTLSLSVAGLPQGANADIQVTGPGGFAQNVTADAVLQGLAPGTYIAVAAPVQSEGHTYTPGIGTLTLAVAASESPVLAAVTYALSTGGFGLTIQGLPSGAVPSVSVSGPSGYQAVLSANATVTGLAAGDYTFSAAPVTVAGDTYGLPAPLTVTVTTSLTPTLVDVPYAIMTGKLAVSVSGLPAGTDASVQVSGPAGYSVSVTQTSTLTGLAPGSYVIAAAPVTSGTSTFAAVPATQTVGVSASTTAAPATVAYSGAPAGPNLFIDGLYVTQSVQTYGGTVPLVAGRDGLLRVFVRASAPNVLTPDVRVRLYDGGTLVNTLTIAAPGLSVPTTVNEGTLPSSWNVVLPAALVQPGLRILADVDPANGVAEGDEGDNAFPAAGTPLALDVRSVPALNLRFVPVTQSVNGLTGNVTGANQQQFLATMRKVYPLASIDADVRTAYSTNAPVLQSNDANNAWNTILSEISALRTADGSSRYYYGVVRTTYGSGVAGLGYVPGRSAIGWDYLPSGAGVAAHELGHNFGRWHAPCGGAGQVDPTYPYGGGTIGVYGYDAATATLKAPGTTDLMGYCSNTWISDYNYVAVLNYRASNPAVLTAGASQASILIWGRVTGGQVILEPAYEIDAPASLPVRPGPNAIEGLDESGARLFSLSFEGDRIADARGANDQTFAFAVPVSMLRGRALARLRLTAIGKQTESRAAGRAGDPVLRGGSTPAATRVGADAVRVDWIDPSVRGALIRDARTGEILTFARSGGAIVRTRSAELDVVVSDGVRSERRRLIPR